MLRSRLVEWARTDPLAALGYTRSQISPRIDRDETVTAILHQWVKAEPGRAWGWAQENSPHDSVGLLCEIAKVDPQLAWTKAGLFAEEHPEHKQASYMSALNGSIYSGDYDLALKMIDISLRSGLDQVPDAKYAFTETVLAEWVRHSPEEAIAWVSSLPEEGNASDKLNAHQALVVAWSGIDPRAALDYAQQLPGNQNREVAMSTALDALIGKDLNQAADWLRRNESGPELDRAVFKLATRPSLLREGGETAIAWANTIKDPHLREEGIRDIATEWLVRSPVEAARYLDQNKFLSADARRHAEVYAKKRIERMKNPVPYNGIE